MVIPMSHRSSPGFSSPPSRCKIVCAFRGITYAASDYLVDMLIRETKEAEQCGRFSVTM